MDIEGAQARDVEDGLREQHAVSCDDDGIGLEGRELCDGLVVLEGSRGEHLDAVLERRHLDLAGMQGLAAARGSVGARVNGNDVMACGDKRLEGGDGVGGRAHEDDAH